MKIIELDRHEQLSLSLPDCQRSTSNQIGFANNYSKMPKSHVNIGCFHKYGQIINYVHEIKLAIQVLPQKCQNIHFLILILVTLNNFDNLFG